MSMFGYKTILQLDGSDKGYELTNFSFTFSQPIDREGKAQSEVKAGVLEMLYENLPSGEMSKWMLNARNFRNGSVQIYGENESLLQEVCFAKATCIGMDIRYMESGTGYCMTHLVVQAYSISVEDVLVENNWKNIMP
ncbi:MAG: type VI secretion system needle protein Hcp [Paludibacteraceae bacterium]|nr:type VI secretion system needle protein Hcp [Paludibacteraceae bacterium]